MAYSVVYAKLEKTSRHRFNDIQTAIEDHLEKRRADDSEVFDDRFIMSIKGEGGRAVYISR